MESSLLFQPEIQQAICSNLSFEEMVHLFSTSTSFQKIGENCEITLVDSINGEIYTLKGITWENLQIHQLIEQFGIDLALFSVDNNPKLFQKLLDLHANINVRNRHGKSILIHAIETNQTRIVEYLIKLGLLSSPEAKNLRESALTFSINIKRDEILKILIDHKIHLYDPGLSETLLYWAIRSGRLFPVKLLLDSGISPNSYYQGVSMLMTAVSSKNIPLSVVQLLIEKGADINVVDLNQSSLLLSAARTGSKEVAEYLFESGCDFHTPDVDGNTVLMWAVRNGYESLARKLLDSGANINAKTINGKTALFFAIIYRQEKCVQLLLEHEANVNIVDDNLKSPLIEAVYYSNSPFVVQLLLKAGANIYHRDLSGKRAIGYAISSSEVYNLLKEALEKKFN